MTRGIREGDERDRGWFPEFAPAPFDQLTARERQVTFHLAHGLFPREIAPMIGSKVKTVDSHRLNAMKKLGITNTVLLARLAIKVGFVMPHDPGDACTCGKSLPSAGFAELRGAWQQLVGRHDVIRPAR